MLPLPQKPVFDPVTPMSYYVRAAKLYNAWRRRGVGDAFAVGMVAQADMEAAFRTDVVGDRDQAFGPYQWHWRPRGQAILAATRIDVRHEDDLDRVVEAAWWELNHTEKKAFAAISKASTAADAARAACTLFEGAGAADAAERRAQDAEFWATFFARNLAWVRAQR